MDEIVDVGVLFSELVFLLVGLNSSLLFIRLLDSVKEVAYCFCMFKSPLLFFGIFFDYFALLNLSGFSLLWGIFNRLIG